MKKSNHFVLLIAVLVLVVAACGESEEERQAREQARLDSIRIAQQAEIAAQMAALQQDSSTDATDATPGMEEAGTTLNYQLTQDGHFVVQVGAWRSEEKAQSFVNKLSSRDYPAAYVVKTGDETTGDVWFRVRVGYLSTRDGAKLLGQELGQELNSGYWIANRD